MAGLKQEGFFFRGITYFEGREVYCRNLTGFSSQTTENKKKNKQIKKQKQSNEQMVQEEKKKIDLSELRKNTVRYL